MPPSATLALALGLFVLPARTAPDDRDDAVRLARAEAIARTKAEVEALIERYGGVEEIRWEIEPFIEEVRYVMGEQQDNGARTFFKGGNHFNKGITDMALRPEWVHADPERSARAVIIDFDRKLKEVGVDLIVCPVPSKIEAYTRDFETGVPDGIPLAIGRLTEILALLEADVEVVDLLPTLLDTMTEDDAIPVYERSGHHISGIGVRAVAEMIQERIDRYEFPESDPERFTDERRTATERVNRGVPMEAWPVLDRGEPYEHVPDSKIVVMGDSHAFAYLTASWACQTARCAGMPITDISVSSGAASAHKRLASQGMEMLKRRRVVIWVITSVALTQSWETTEIPERATVPGLIVAGAIDEAIAAVKANEGNLSALGVRESELIELGRDLVREPETQDQGIEVLEITTLAFPHSAEAFFNLANAYMTTDDRDQARVAFEKTLSLNPDASIRGNSLRVMREIDPGYTPPARHTLSAAAMAALVGEYALSGGARGLVRVEGAGLVFEYVGQPVLAMQPLSDTRFTTEQGFLVEFTPGKDGAPMNVRLSAEGQVFEGPRVPE